MRLPRGLAGLAAGPLVHEVDARWLMAYAAASGDPAPEYMDTLRPGGILSHPLFPVCYEWPAAVELRARLMPPEVAARGVHATHDLSVHRRARVGDRLSTSAVIALVEPRQPGAYVMTRFLTEDAQGHPVSSTSYGSLYLGIECEREEAALTGHGSAQSPLRATHDKAAEPRWSASVPVAAGAAHVYTEGARIWNPIHTDRAVAIAAGLPDIILHGTATLALAVSEVLRQAGHGPTCAVSRIACRFGGMVRLPSLLRVLGHGEAGADGGRWLGFSVVDRETRPVIRDGWILVRDPLGGSVEPAAIKSEW